MNGRNKQILVVGGLVVVVIILAIIGNRSNHNANTLGGESVSATSSAFLVYNNQAYLPFNVDANNLIKEDMAYFARKNFKTYDPAKQPSVVFNITEQPVTKGFVTTFSGSYEKSKDNISVSVTLLKNSRIKTTITDTTTRTVSDNGLPSNSDRNQYIASLPVITTEYSIDYSSYTDTFLITLFNVNAKDNAQNALQSGLHSKTLDSSEYQLTVTPSYQQGGAPLLQSN